MKKFWILLITILLIIPTLAQDTPDLPDDFPMIEVFSTDEVANGYIYLSNFRGRDVESEFGHYLMILDNAGTPVFYQPTRPTRGFNFGRNPDGTLYYFQLLENGIDNSGFAINGVYRILDEEGNLLREVHTQNGLTNTAPHEFYQRENGNIFLLSHDVRILNMTRYGGHPEAIVVGLIIQEIDPQNQVIWEWASWGKLAMTDVVSDEFLQAEPPSAVAVVHGNGMTLDANGDIILSARVLDELIKINYETGDILWRMGGSISKQNQFTFINDPYFGFSGQHHPHILPNGNLLLFDNGNFREGDNRISRVVEYELDEANKTATLVWSYTDGRFTPTMGSVQRLDNGNTLIGWGSTTGLPNITEVNPDGEVVFSLNFPDGQFTYRAYRFPYGDKG